MGRTHPEDGEKGRSPHPNDSPTALSKDLLSRPIRMDCLQELLGLIDRKSLQYVSNSIQNFQGIATDFSSQTSPIGMLAIKVSERFGWRTPRGLHRVCLLALPASLVLPYV